MDDEAKKLIAMVAEVVDAAVAELTTRLDAVEGRLDVAIATGGSLLKLVVRSEYRESRPDADRILPNATSAQRDRMVAEVTVDSVALHVHPLVRDMLLKNRDEIIADLCSQRPPVLS